MLCSACPQTRGCLMSGPVQHVYDIIPCVDSPTDPRLDGLPFNVKFGPVDVVLR